MLQGNREASLGCVRFKPTAKIGWREGTPQGPDVGQGFGLLFTPKK